MRANRSSSSIGVSQYRRLIEASPTRGAEPGGTPDRSKLFGSHGQRPWLHEVVTADTVLGGICVYLLIGFVFFYLFDMVELIHPGAFLERDQRLRPPVNAEHLLIRRPELNYFSFVTLTTVGFGDITPVDPLARVLTVLEALFGQIYLVTFLAFLVGNYISQRDASRRVTALPSSPRIASGQDVDGGEARDKAATNAVEG
jgi:ion channel